MPIHDWSNADANLFHHFHQAWGLAICDSLNQGVLPRGYSALVDQRNTAGVVPDVLTVQRRGGPGGAGLPGSGVLATEPPKTRHVFETKEAAQGARGNRIVVRHRLGAVVCIIEVVSPGNKSSKHGIKAFLDKTWDLLDQGVNLLILDLFPPTPRDPLGIHRAIWDHYQETDFEPPADKPLTLAAYVATNPVIGSESRAYVEPVATGDTLPDMPAYLDWQSYVPVPLESSYQAAWARCPEDMRILVETGRLPGEDP